MRSPFKFLDAYTRDDAKVFFGRDEEIDALYQLVFKTPLLLVYGLSGTGKTSLIQCGLASRYDGPDWNPFFVRRQSNINDALQSALATATRGQDFDNLPDTISYLFRYYLRPVYLIFDQFEELFLLGSPDEQEQFMQDIQQLLAADLPCKIILVMREEYIGQLYNFEKVVPSLFDFRFRVEPMNAAKVKTVMSSSFEAFNINLEPPEDDRLQQMVDNLSAGKSGIQLPYLQVYLDMLYREDYARTFTDDGALGRGDQETEYPELTFTKKEIEDFGRIEEVLEKFLRQQEADLQAHLKEKYPDLPREAVRNILDAFVTEEGTKRPVAYRRDEDTNHIELEQKVAEALPALTGEALTTALEALEQRRLLRITNDSIELAHDSLAALIDEQRTDEQRRLNEVKRRLRSNYAEHRQTGEYLSRKQLNAYEDSLPQLRLEPEVQRFLEESRDHVEKLERAEEERRQRELELTRQKLEAEQRAARRQRTFSGIIGLVALVAIALGVWAFTQRAQARKAEQQAVQAEADLRSQVFNNQINQGQSLKSDGRYEEAITQLRLAEKYAEADSQQQRIDTLVAQFNRLSELISRGDTLRLQGAAQWNKALENFRAAYAISDDALIENRIDQMRRDIDNRFNELMASADGIRQFSGCRYALGVYRQAAQLKPENEEVQRKIRECGG